ncbi:MAG TPA: hypothetical protein VLA31_00410 [Burkholderiaceae bacterium]|nr:hypothetical protein [Burkholderiaceae bacterium]
MTQITIDRALVEQALGALEVATTPLTKDRQEVLRAQATLRAVLAQPAPEPETCTWHQDGDSDSGLYGTSCGRFFDLTDGTPEDNKMSWCCYCGKKLVQKLITENSDD